MTRLPRPNSVLEPTSKNATSHVTSFPDDPLSATKARRFVRECLVHAALSDTLIDLAELTVSELVTNSVLHAATGPTVTLHTNEHRVRLEVQDACTTVPVIVGYGNDAVTGRGLGVVSKAASRWGVESSQYSKTVWAEFDIDGNPTPDDETPPINHLEPIADEQLGKDAKTVYLKHVPVDLYLELEQSNDAILREIGSMPYFPAGAQVRAGRYFDASRQRLRLQVQRAHFKGLATVDLYQVVDEQFVVYAQQLAALMAEADLLSDRGVLLTSPSPRSARRLRHWLTDEMRNQFQNNCPPIPFTA